MGDLVPQALQVPSHPLALGRRLRKDARPGLVPEHYCKPLPPRHDPALHDLPGLRQLAELTLALVQIKPYRIDSGWPLVVATTCRGWPSRFIQLSAIR